MKILNIWKNQYLNYAPPSRSEGPRSCQLATQGGLSTFEQVLTINYVTTVTTFTADTTVNIVLIVITAKMVSSVTVGY